MRTEPPPKRRRVEESVGDAFVAKLLQISSECDTGPSKHIKILKRDCEEAMQEGYAGHTREFYLLNFLCNLQEFLNLIKPLEVVKAGFGRSERTMLLITVKLPEVELTSPPGAPCWNEQGNLVDECHTCLCRETMVLPVPCGHMMGQQCAKKLADAAENGKFSICPVCRKEIWSFNPIFKV